MGRTDAGWGKTTARTLISNDVKTVDLERVYCEKVIICKDKKHLDDENHKPDYGIITSWKGANNPSPCDFCTWKNIEKSS